MKNHNELILEHLSSGVITMDTSYRITSFNRRAREILGLRDQDVVGKEVSVLGKRLSRILINRLRTPIRYLEEQAYVPVEGKGEIPLGVVSTVMKGQEDVLGVLLVFDDLTNEKLLQEKIRRADRLASVGTLAAGMAHEIKNPLVSIKTFSQLLPEKYDDREFRETFSSITIREVERINHIVEQLLNFARPLKPKLQEADVHTIIEETLELVAEEISEKKVDIVRHFTNEPSVILVDREQIKQVILNLLKNSLQAIKGEKGRVEILTSFVSEPLTGVYRLASERAGNEKEPIDAELLSDLLTKKFRIQIRDNGVGIPKEDLSNLFDPFFTTKSDGFGLGLAIAHGIIQEHNGTIEIESEVGVGTTVTVKIPAIKAG